MNVVDQLRRLAANNAWSNLRLLESCTRLSLAEYEAPRTSFFPSIPVHQIHDRGQVHAMLARTSVTPPQADEYFLSEDLPLRERELRELLLPLV